MGYLLKKIDETGDVKRREGSGRLKSSRTENNINAVKELISSQEDKSGTRATPNEISKMIDIPRTSIRRIIVQNDRTYYAPSAYKKSTIENKRLYVKRSGFPISLMISVAVSKVGKSSIFFVEPG